jgi:hypothetical protein
MNDEEFQTYIKEKVAEIVATGREEIYLPAYRANIQDPEVLGVIVGRFFEWGGKSIIQAFLSALEEANFHELRAQIEKLLDDKPQATQTTL